MLGWMFVFALMSLFGCAEVLTGQPVASSMGIASIIFAGLFVAGLLTRAARGRIW
jgi:hypothetical protein